MAGWEHSGGVAGGPVALLLLMYRRPENQDVCWAKTDYAGTLSWVVGPNARPIPRKTSYRHTEEGDNGILALEE